MIHSFFVESSGICRTHVFPFPLPLTTHEKMLNFFTFIASFAPPSTGWKAAYLKKILLPSIEIDLKLNWALLLSPVFLPLPAPSITL